MTDYTYKGKERHRGNALMRALEKYKGRIDKEYKHGVPEKHKARMRERGAPTKFRKVIPSIDE